MNTNLPLNVPLRQIGLPYPPALSALSPEGFPCDNTPLSCFGRVFGSHAACLLACRQLPHRILAGLLNTEPDSRELQSSRCVGSGGQKLGPTGAANISPAQQRTSSKRIRTSTCRVPVFYLCPSQGSERACPDALIFQTNRCQKERPKNSETN